MSIWTNKTFYDARYVTESDLYHRLINILLLVILAVAVLHIRSVDILNDPSNEPSIFVFTLMLVLERALWSIQTIELYFLGVGQKAVKESAKRDLFGANICLPFYLAATVLAARDLNEDQDHNRVLAAEDTTAYGAESAYDGSTTDIPIILCLAGFVLGQVLFGVNVIFCFPAGGRHKEM